MSTTSASSISDSEIQSECVSGDENECSVDSAEPKKSSLFEDEKGDDVSCKNKKQKDNERGESSTESEEE